MMNTLHIFWQNKLNFNAFKWLGKLFVLLLYFQNTFQTVHTDLKAYVLIKKNGGFK